MHTYISTEVSSSISRFLALYLTFPFPITKAESPANAQNVIVPTIGSAVPVWKKLTAADTSPPIAILKLPISAAALPAYLEKGAKDKAVALGLDNPCPVKNTNNRTIKPYCPTIL